MMFPVSSATSSQIQVNKFLEVESGSDVTGQSLKTSKQSIQCAKQCVRRRNCSGFFMNTQNDSCLLNAIGDGSDHTSSSVAGAIQYKVGILCQFVNYYHDSENNHLSREMPNIVTEVDGMII